MFIVAGNVRIRISDFSLATEAGPNQLCLIGSERVLITGNTVEVLELLSRHGWIGIGAGMCINRYNVESYSGSHAKMRFIDQAVLISDSAQAQLAVDFDSVRAVEIKYLNRPVNP